MQPEKWRYSVELDVVASWNFLSSSGPMIKIWILCFVLIFSCSNVTAEDWPRFRGAQACGIGSGPIPVNWSDSENLAWKTRLPGKGSSSPIVIGDLVFVTAYSGYGESLEQPGDRANLKLHVVCLSLSTGELIWDKQFESSPEEQAVTKRVVDHGYASPTPCADEKNVYASFGPSGVVALTHKGDELWRRGVGTNTAGFGAAASPIEFDDLVIMNASIEDGAVYGLEKESGKVRWRTDQINRAWTTPTIVPLANGSVEMVLNQKGAVLGLDPRTGKKLWSCYAIQDYVVPCALVKNETLFCSGGRSNKTFVVKAGGRGDVSESHLVWDVSLGANVTTPILVGDYLYWSHDKGVALCLRASDGEQMFRERLPSRSRVYAFDC